MTARRSTGNARPPMRPVGVLGIALVAAVLAACASAGGAGREAASLARFEAAAGDPVDSFRFFSLQGYTVLGEHQVAVWTGQREAWLLTVDEPCSELRWSMALELTSFSGRVLVHTDSAQGCRIRSIQPVNVAMLRASECVARDQGQSAGGT